MEPKWIKPTEGLQNGISLINDMDNSKLQQLLSHIVEKSDGKLFTPDELTALEKILKLTPEQIGLVVKTIKHIIKRMSKFIMRPTQLSVDLMDGLKLQQKKAGMFVEVYKFTMKNIADDFDIKDFGDMEMLTEMAWQVNIELSSSRNKKEKNTSVLLDLKTVQKNKLTDDKTLLDLYPEEMKAFHQQIEGLQNEVDNVISNS